MGTGLRALGEKQVNFSVDGSTDGVAGTQADPAVAALSNGDFVVVYENPHAGTSDIDLVAHFFDASGNAINPPVSSGLINGVVSIDRSADVTIHPAIAATANGGFVVAYTDATQQSIDVRRYDSTTGVSAPFIIDTGINHQPNVRPLDDATIATFADGNSVVVWEYQFSATDYDLDYAFLNSTASGFVKNPNAFAVQNSFEGEARAATSGNLGAIVYAAGPGTVNGGQDIILRLFNSSGVEQAMPATIFGTANSDVFSHPDVAALSDGRFVIVARDDTAPALVASVYDPVTHAVTPLFTFGGITGAATDLHVAGVPGGGFVMSFDNPTGDVIEGRFGPGGSVLFSAGLANSFTTGTQAQNAIAANASGTVFFAWQDAGSGNPNSTDTDTRIEAQAFHLQLLSESDSDFTGSGTSGVLLANSSGAAIDWVLQNGSYQSYNAIGSTAGYSIAGTGDFNGDGTADVLLQNSSSGTIIDWMMSNGSYSSYNPFGSAPGWNILGTGDFNGDGVSDVLLQDGNGNMIDWLLQNGQYSSYQSIGNANSSGYGFIKTGDFNGDGTTDVLLENGSGNVIDWMMNNGTYQSYNNVGSAGGYGIVGTGDFNGDGTTDILLENGSGNLIDWTMQNGKYASWNEIGNTSGYGVVATGDYNGDGTTDVLLENSSRDVIDWTMQNGTFSGWHGVGNAMGYAVSKT